MHNLIPKPESILEAEGKFIFSEDVHLFVGQDNSEIVSIARLLNVYLGEATGDYCKIFVGDPWKGNIQLALNGDTSLGEEGYELSITPDSVTISANCPAGLFYGVQTLWQMLPTNPSRTMSLPAVSIRDIPRFEWRGAMLDVSLHFSAWTM